MPFGNKGISLGTWLKTKRLFKRNKKNRENLILFMVGWLVGWLVGWFCLIYIILYNLKSNI
ncbi:hypothetical protein BIW12_13705 [Flavobacterium commune]|uniref:Uncharacterized protein n=1 Tax=Flavobacterium commune TaxID=1306519 RepID=A0A1D9PCS7_9FLAO|nr:hypothetical protein BIW12_13705 [Flavobacterium commune]